MLIQTTRAASVNWWQAGRSRSPCTGWRRTSSKAQCPPQVLFKTLCSPRLHGLCSRGSWEAPSRSMLSSRTVAPFRSGPKSAWFTFLDTPPAASPSTCRSDGSSSLVTHCSTSSAGGSAHPRQESPNGQERRCSPLRNSSTWTSIPYASVTSHSCGTSPIKPFERSYSGMPPDCGHSGSAPIYRDAPLRACVEDINAAELPRRRGGRSHG